MLKYNSTISGILLSVAAFAQPFIPTKTLLNGATISTESRLSNLKTESIGPTIMSGRITDIEVNPSIIELW